MGLVSHRCEFCGKEYKNYFKESKYCSSKCYNDFRKLNARLVEKPCPNCGTMFKPHDSNTIYCSRKCAGEANQVRESCVCDNCGKLFTRIESELNKHSMHFCSKECMKSYLWWSKEDEQILIDNYNKLSCKEISLLLGRDISEKAVCRKAMSLGLTVIKYWSDDEVQILIDNYSIKPMDEILNMLPNRTPSAILGQARKYDLKSFYYLNRVYSKDDYEYLKKNYVTKSYEEMSLELGRTITAIKIRMNMLDLHKPTEIANYRSIYNYMRSRVTPWRDAVREKYNYTCSVSGSRSNVIVHHIRSFNLLLEECADILNFPYYENFGDYSQDQLDEFADTFFELQEYYGAYTCVNEKIHKQFHKMYGYGDNTQEQWDEFVLKYKQNIA